MAATGRAAGEQRRHPFAEVSPRTLCQRVPLVSQAEEPRDKRATLGAEARRPVSAPLGKWPAPVRLGSPADINQKPTDRARLNAYCENRGVTGGEIRETVSSRGREPAFHTGYLLVNAPLSSFTHLCNGEATLDFKYNTACKSNLTSHYP